MIVDRSGNSYEEVEMSSGNVRVTYIPNGWDGQPSVRIQIRDESGRLRQGPEIPMDVVGNAVRSLVELIVKKNEQ